MGRRFSTPAQQELALFSLEIQPLIVHIMVGELVSILSFGDGIAFMYLELFAVLSD